MPQGLTALLTVTPELDGQRVDKLLAAAVPELSRSRAKALFAAGNVIVVDARGRRRIAVKGERAVSGTRIELLADPGSVVDAAAAAPEVELSIVLETADVVVVDKPSGLPSAPLRLGEARSVANGLLARYPEMAEVGYSPREPGLCHRLDTLTSGLLVAARHARAFDAITGALRCGRVDKRYLLICQGGPAEDAGTIALPLAADPKSKRRVRACGDAREAERLRARAAQTVFRVLRRCGGRALVEARAPCAFRHQIRAHFAAIGAPLVGDEVYGAGAALGLGRHALHASAVRWLGAEPVHGFDVTSALPAELAALLDA